MGMAGASVVAAHTGGEKWPVRHWQWGQGVGPLEAISWTLNFSLTVMGSTGGFESGTGMV